MKKIKIMCVVLCIIFAFSVVLTACRAPATPSPTPTPEPTPTPVAEVPKPEVMELTMTFFFGDATEHLVWKREYQDWFTEKFGIELVVNTPSRNNYIEVINLAVVAGDLRGLVRMFSYPELYTWAAEGLILPLTDYLKDNEVWNTKIPDMWKEDATFQGDIWAIPAGSDMRPSWFARHIRGDWLTNVGLTRPDTIQQFYEAIYRFTYNDPDQDGLADTIGMTSRTTWLMGDIFMTFDARVNHLNAPMPNYNPNTEEWEDPMLKPGMVEALQWLKKAYDEKILDPELWTASASVVRARITAGFAGSIFDWVHQPGGWNRAINEIQPGGHLITIGAMQGTTAVNRKVNFYGVGSGAPWAMTIHTPQPRELANWFVNIFFGSAEGVYIGRLGIMGTMRGTGMFTIEGNRIFGNFLPPAAAGGPPVAFPAPGIIGGHPDYELDRVFEYVFYSDNAAWNTEQTELRLANSTRLNNIFDEYNALGRLWALTEALKEPSCELWLQQGVRADQSRAASEAISTANVGSATIEEALAKYREIARALNMQQVLDTANEKLGKTSSQRY